ncbi:MULTISPECIES: CHAT domain-containing protein [unclassified Microcoleus]|uniref:CHAT domain-containing protein n=1 Tax=unclassified Microcoleus TaxID=2642155 RepID=UPI002FD62CB7
MDYKPQIIHFSGHGAGDEGLALEDETGKVQYVDAEALAELFKLFANRVECVVLNACYSEVQAEAIVQHVPYVIGMSRAIGDKAAIEFAVGFYDALGSGESVEFAYQLGCNSIRLAGIVEHLTPKLKKKH